jgi:hypothetical protein
LVILDCEEVFENTELFPLNDAARLPWGLGEAFVQAPIMGCFAPPIDLFALLRGKFNRLHSDQHPPPPELAAEQRAEAQLHLAEILQRRVAVPPEEIHRRLKEQRRELGRLVSWLDQCPLPPEGPGHVR